TRSPFRGNVSRYAPSVPRPGLTCPWRSGRIGAMAAAAIRSVRVAPKDCAATDNGPHVSCACSDGSAGAMMGRPAAARSVPREGERVPTATPPRRLALTLLRGPSLAPVTAEIDAGLRAAKVAVRMGARTTFELTFSVGRHRFSWGNLLANGYFDPGTRLTLVTDGDARVLVDGIVTGQELSLSGSGRSQTLVVSGEDLSVLMDLNEVALQYPGEPAHVRAQVIIARYAVYGIEPAVVPAPIVEIPISTERIPTQAETDYRYLRRLAENVGYLFAIQAGPAPGRSGAYWGPPVRTGTPQAPIVADGGAVSELRFRLDGLARTEMTAMILDPATRTLLPIPVPDVRVVRAQLAARPAPTLRHCRLFGAAKRTVAGAAASALGAMALTSDAVIATGTL